MPNYIRLQSNLAIPERYSTIAHGDAGDYSCCSSCELCGITSWWSREEQLLDASLIALCPTHLVLSHNKTANVDRHVNGTLCIGGEGRRRVNNGHERRRRVNQTGVYALKKTTCFLRRRRYSSLQRFHASCKNETGIYDAILANIPLKIHEIAWSQLWNPATLKSYKQPLVHPFRVSLLYMRFWIRRSMRFSALNPYLSVLGGHGSVLRVPQEGLATWGIAGAAK